MTAITALPLGAVSAPLSGTTTSAGTEATGSGSFSVLLQDGATAASPAPPASPASTAGAAADMTPAHAADGETSIATSLPTEQAATDDADAVAAAEEAETERPDPLLADDGSQPWPPLGLSGLGLALGEPQPAATPTTVAASTGTTSSAVADKGTPLPTAMLAANTSQTAQATVLAPSGQDTAVLNPIPGGDASAQALSAQGESMSAATLNAVAGDASAPSASTMLLQGLAALESAARPSATSSLAAPPTPTPVFGQEGFEDAIGARVGWLADQKIGHAHIRISPDDMGTIEVRLQLDGDRVHASFNSANAEVRQALESSLGRLRDMLGEHGMQLGNADIGHDPGSPQHNGQGADGANRVAGAEPALADAAGTPPPLLQRLSLLDTYA